LSKRTSIACVILTRYIIQNTYNYENLLPESIHELNFIFIGQFVDQGLKAVGKCLYKENLNVAVLM